MVKKSINVFCGLVLCYFSFGNNSFALDNINVDTATIVQTNADYQTNITEKEQHILRLLNNVTTGFAFDYQDDNDEQNDKENAVEIASTLYVFFDYNCDSCKQTIDNYFNYKYTHILIKFIPIANFTNQTDLDKAAASINETKDVIKQYNNIQSAFKDQIINPKTVNNLNREKIIDNTKLYLLLDFELTPAVIAVKGDTFYVKQGLITEKEYAFFNKL